jgi:Flp pilus assembly protein TadG
MRNRRGNDGRLNRRCGTATIEMAIVTPLLMTFALAATDFGRVVHAYHVVSNAARSGADNGSRHGFTTHSRAAWEAAIRQAAVDEMQGLGGFQDANLQIATDVTTDADGLFRAAVTVDYPFQTAVAWPGLPNSVSLRHRVEMRRIR